MSPDNAYLINITYLILLITCDNPANEPIKFSVLMDSYKSVSHCRLSTPRSSREMNDRPTASRWLHRLTIHQWTLVREVAGSSHPARRRRRHHRCDVTDPSRIDRSVPSFVIRLSCPARHVGQVRRDGDSPQWRRRVHGRQRQRYHYVTRGKPVKHASIRTTQSWSLGNHRECRARTWQLGTERGRDSEDVCRGRYSTIDWESEVSERSAWCFEQNKIPCCIWNNRCWRR